MAWGGGSVSTQIPDAFCVSYWQILIAKKRNLPFYRDSGFPVAFYLWPHQKPCQHWDLRVLPNPHFGGEKNFLWDEVMVVCLQLLFFPRDWQGSALLWDPTQQGSLTQKWFCEAVLLVLIISHIYFKIIN